MKKQTNKNSRQRSPVMNYFHQPDLVLIAIFFLQLACCMVTLWYHIQWPPEGPKIERGILPDDLDLPVITSAE